MRLQTKTNLLYASLSLAVVITGGLLYFFLVHTIVQEEIEERLDVRRRRIEQDLNNGIIAFSDDIIQQIIPIESTTEVSESSIDTLLYDAFLDEFVPYRQLTFKARSAKQPYRIVLRQSLLETEDILESVQITIISIMIVLLGGLWLLNRLVVDKLWAPFHETLNAVRNHDFMSGESLSRPESSTTEFSELNATVTAMASRIQRDIRRLKEFTENASHEMQTPLAVLLSELESLMEGNRFDSTQLASIQSATRAATKLSSLNKTLLLLTRIEGAEYLEKTIIDIHEEIETVLDDFDDLLTSKELRITKDFGEPLKVSINLTLARIMISNLIKNSLVHSNRGGLLRFHTSNLKLRVENTGRPLRCDPGVLFERFRKDNQTYSSLGLGLSIVKSICDVNGFTVTYNNEGDLHILTVDFGPMERHTSI